MRPSVIMYVHTLKLPTANKLRRRLTKRTTEDGAEENRS